MTEIKKPSPAQVRIYLKKWEALENGKYQAQEFALNKLFGEMAPTNKSLDDVLLKVAALNTFYSTNIKSVFTVARHIHNLDIDERLCAGDDTLVDEIANVKMSDGKTRNEFSFATKYCSHHNADAYPIYDRHVVEVLCRFKGIDAFSDFRKEELRSFTKFKRVMRELRKFYNLEKFTWKAIDRYLWQLGKGNFS